MSWSFRIGVVLGVLAFAGAVAAAAFPGPHRMVCPTCYGLNKIGPRVFTDAPDARHGEIMKLVHLADRKIGAFFGTLRSAPQIVVCTTQSCRRSFSRGRSPSGLTYGWHAIFISPRGVRANIITHERAHAELHYRLGTIGLTRNAIPAWFDEGLAVLLAEDARLVDRFKGLRVTAWIRKANWPWQWSKLIKSRGWRDTYGAAAARVKAYADVIGRTGLRRVIDEVIKGADFETALYREVVRAKRRG